MSCIPLCEYVCDCGVWAILRTGAPGLIYSMVTRTIQVPALSQEKVLSRGSVSIHGCLCNKSTRGSVVEGIPLLWSFRTTCLLTTSDTTAHHPPSSLFTLQLQLHLSWPEHLKQAPSSWPWHWPFSAEHTLLHLDFHLPPSLTWSVCSVVTLSADLAWIIMENRTPCHSQHSIYIHRILKNFTLKL